MSEEKTTAERKQPSSVRHTRAIQRERERHPPAAPPPAEIAERLTELVHPRTLALVDLSRQLGLRMRTLTLPVMLALVLDMIWRQGGSISELTRRIGREAVLWASPRKVSQQALPQRLTTLPAELFWRVLLDVLPQLQQRWQVRQRPVAPEIAWAEAHYTGSYSADGSALDSLIRKIGLLRDLPETPLAGKINALLHLGSRLPARIWYTANALANDAGFWAQILEVLQAGDLLLTDRGYTHFTIFAQLTALGVTFITRAKANLSYTVERVERTVLYRPHVHNLVCR
jgi:hypothetical protein